MSITTEGWGSGGITTDGWGYPPIVLDHIDFILRVQRTSTMELLFERNQWLSLSVDRELSFELELEVAVDMTLRVDQQQTKTLKTK